ncbi:MAG: hypothetical protein EAX95_06510 [Candidatus Thorarchaeota archaeon]|nr:hypothetical protein [Candidatus Thorarchaeota archaeon]
MSEEINALQRKILNIVLEDSRRAGSITRLLKRSGFECEQNEVVQAMNDLVKRGLLERPSEKTWTATGKAQDYAE